MKTDSLRSTAFDEAQDSQTAHRECDSRAASCSGVALPPKQIWLQWDGDGEPSGMPIEKRGEVCWCQDKIFDGDIEYLRRDEVSKIVTAFKNLRDAISDFKGHGMPGFTDRALAYIVMREADEILKHQNNQGER